MEKRRLRMKERISKNLPLLLIMEVKKWVIWLFNPIGNCLKENQQEPKNFMLDYRFLLLFLLSTSSLVVPVPGQQK